VNTWKVILATMVIFGAGVVTGGLLVRHAMWARPFRAAKSSQSTRPTAISAGSLRIEFLRRAERELDLTTGQREQIDRILSASQDRTKKIMEPVAPRMRELMQQTKDQVRAVLTPEQQKRFDEMAKAQQQRPHDQKRPPFKKTDPAKPALVLSNAVPAQ
jgi:Spy/CpxP family protein refolding chaperone